MEVRTREFVVEHIAVDSSNAASLADGYRVARALATVLVGYSSHQTADSLSNDGSQSLDLLSVSTLKLLQKLDLNIQSQASCSSQNGRRSHLARLLHRL